MVGSVLPSSRFLSKKMLAPIHFSTAKVIVELGPGTGVFTKALLKQLPADTHLVVIELNDSFFQNLQKQLQHPNLHLVHGSAADLDQIILDLGFEKADYILSSLPLSNFPKELRSAILHSCQKALIQDGKFIQFQYSRGLKKMYSDFFDRVDIQYTALNFPPAFIYTCSNS
ncbi:MAG: rRNA ((1402)-N(4))-methyltransferase [Bacteroidota bacterium]|jgi:phospholipid N-methyltransferase